MLTRRLPTARLWGMVGTAFVAISLLAGCGSSNKASSQMVTIQVGPTSAMQAGCTFTIDNGPAQSGAYSHQFTAGTHTIAFQVPAASVGVWVAPASQTFSVPIALTPNQNVPVLEYTFAPGTGTGATATITATAVVGTSTGVGGTITTTSTFPSGTAPTFTLTGTGAPTGSHANGTVVTVPAGGAYTVTWSDITGLTTPKPSDPINANVGGNNYTVNGVYYTTGSVTVTLLPAGTVAANTGAWMLDSSGTWNQSGTPLTGVAYGRHTLTFKAVTGWITPAAQQIDVGITPAGAAAAPAATTTATYTDTQAVVYLSVNEAIKQTNGVTTSTIPGTLTLQITVDGQPAVVDGTGFYPLISGSHKVAFLPATDTANNVPYAVPFAAPATDNSQTVVLDATNTAANPVVINATWVASWGHLTITLANADGLPAKVGHVNNVDDGTAKGQPITATLTNSTGQVTVVTIPLGTKTVSADLAPDTYTLHLNPITYIVGGTTTTTIPSPTPDAQVVVTAATLSTANLTLSSTSGGSVTITLNRAAKGR
jgi:hypothetical protein